MRHLKVRREGTRNNFVFLGGLNMTDSISLMKNSSYTLNQRIVARHIKGVLHLWALFLKTLCIFSKNKATSDKVSYGSGQKCSKEFKNYSFTSVETIVVKLQ